MAETWVKRTESVPSETVETVYDVKDTTVVRTVSKSQLEAEKAHLLERIERIDADLAKIAELEAK